MQSLPKSPNHNRRGRIRAQAADFHVGARIRERRMMMGLSQQQMADLIGVTYQQAYKYEKGINRIAAGRLHTIAEALGVEVSYFFEGFASYAPVASYAPAAKPTPQQRMLVGLARGFLELNHSQQKAVAALVRDLVTMPGDA